jgi:hypothetical protein
MHMGARRCKRTGHESASGPTFTRTDCRHLALPAARETSRLSLIQVRGGRATIFHWDEISEVFEKPMGTASRYRIALSDGRTRSIAYIVKNHQALGEAIVTRITERVLPQALRIFEKGGTVPFGPLSVSSDLLTYKDKQVGWGQISRLDVEFNPQAKSTFFAVRVGGQLLNWCSVPVQNIPNLRVFMELVRRAYPAFGH